MQLTISFNSDGNVITVELAPDLTLADLKAYIEAESSVPTTRQILMFEGSPLKEDDKALEEIGIKDGDLLLCLETEPEGEEGAQAAATSTNSAASASGQFLGGGMQKFYNDVEKVRRQLKADETLRQGVLQNYPQLIESLEDPVRFREEMYKVETQRAAEEESRRQELKRLEEDPYNTDNQNRILELIHQEKIQENLNSALEHHPEVFGRVTMLYVDVIVNGHKVKAFVDSGAQATIMDMKCVEKCNMSHLIDKRFAGVAKGVGTGKIVGRVHSAPMKLGDSFLPCSFTVMETIGIEMMLGLDMLKRHQGLIDLRNNTLTLGDACVKFLGEADIPEEETAIAQQASSAVGASGSSSSAQFAGLGGGAGPSMSRIPDAQPNPQAGARPFPDETIQNLMGLGFSRDQVVEALNSAGGNPELAAALLFQ